VTCLDAASGDPVWTCAASAGATEIVLAGARLTIAAGEGLGKSGPRGGKSKQVRYPRQLRIMAVEPGTGKVLWQRAGPETAGYLPTTLCATGAHVFFQNATQLVCLHAGSGETKWAVRRPSRRTRVSWSAPTLVVADGVLLSGDVSADRDAATAAKGVKWQYTSGPPRGPAGQGRLIAFSAEDGKRLWDCPTAMNYCAPPDIFVIDGVVWTGVETGRNKPDYRQGRALRTGKVVRTLNTDAAFTTTHHHRCYRDRATTRRIIVGRTGVEFIDLAGGDHRRHCWVRGGCQYGVMPANGMLYLPPPRMRLLHPEQAERVLGVGHAAQDALRHAHGRSPAQGACLRSHQAGLRRVRGARLACVPA
jgi:hypothetical protein